PWYQNKLGSTLNTFTHYAYLLSQETTVLADLQTATAVKENGERVQVLFGVMTHTLNGYVTPVSGSSSVGDHGQPGIDTFLKKYECGNRCRSLRL
ncbi:hypothetical protein B0H13DRAFT_1456654, partial [Mycena leptocephala]